MMKTEKNKRSEKILNLTLEIICLLTGEDYTVLRKTSGKYVTPGSRNNGKKILDLTNKIIELLTGEVPIRCQDVAVYFSMEEWEYLEDHNDLYKDAMMEDHRDRTSPGKKDLYKDIMMEDHRDRTSPVGDEKKDHHEELNTSAQSLRDRREKDGEINGDKYQSNNIEEKPPCDGENCASSNIHVHRTMSGSPRIMEEPVSCSEGNFTDPNNYTPHPTAHIKEEPFSCDRGKLEDPNIHKPTYNTEYPTTSIKEEEASRDNRLADPISCTTTDHSQYTLPNIKEEPVSCDGVGLADPDIHSTIDSSQQYPSTPSKNEPDSYDGGKVTNPGCTIPVDHTPQYPHKEEKALDEISTSQKPQSSPLGKAEAKRVSKRKLIEAEHNYNDITSSKKYFCTIQQTSHSLQIRYNCPECPESFTSNLDLAKHQIIHSGGMAFICSVCGKCFGRQSDLMRQFTNWECNDSESSHCEHLADKSSLSIHEQKKPPPCPECGITFPSKKRLTRRGQIHTDERPFKCPECVDTLKRKVYLQRPAAPEQNYNDITKSSKEHFCNVQQTTHSLEIRYNCPECPESFTSNLDLAKHQISHTGGMPFICSVCGRCFSRKSDLVVHQLTHGESHPHR